MEESRVRLPGNELELSTRRFGDPSKPTLIMISGHEVTLNGYGHLPEYFAAAGFCVITYDHRGMGLSSPVIAPYTFDDLANDCAAVLDHYAVEHAFIFGMSMGGMVAQRFAVLHVRRTKALVLASTGVLGGNNVLRMLFQESLTVGRLLAFQATNGGIKRGMPRDKFVKARVDFLRLALSSCRCQRVLTPLWYGTVAGMVSAIAAAYCGRLPGGRLAVLAIILLLGSAYALVSRVTRHPRHGVMDDEDVAELNWQIEHDFDEGRIDWDGSGSRGQKAATETAAEKGQLAAHKVACAKLSGIIPTLSIHGTEDPICPLDLGLELAGLFGAEVIAMDGVGHLLPVSPTLKGVWFDPLVQFLRSHV